MVNSLFEKDNYNLYKNAEGKPLVARTIAIDRLIEPWDLGFKVPYSTTAYVMKQVRKEGLEP